MTEISKRYMQANTIMETFKHSRDPEQRRRLLDELEPIRLEFDLLAMHLEDFIDRAELELRTGE